MARVLCAVDGSHVGRQAVDAAVAFCREHNADLELVGVVKERLSDSTRATGGELVRRYNQVQFELARAAAIAREAGLTPEIALRSGNMVKELLREADATLAEEVFLARRHSRIWAALTGRPRETVTRVTLAGAPRTKVEYELKKAA